MQSGNKTAGSVGLHRDGRGACKRISVYVLASISTLGLASCAKAPAADSSGQQSDTAGISVVVPDTNVNSMPGNGTGNATATTTTVAMQLPQQNAAQDTATAGTGGSVDSAGSMAGTIGEAPVIQDMMTDDSAMPAIEDPAPTVALDGDPVPSAGCGKADSPGSGDFSLDISGTARTYIVATPRTYDPNKTYRLVFTWHYLGGSASGIARSGYYGMQSLAGDSAIFVSPEGIDAGWSNSGGRDVAFATALMAHMKENYCVDEARVFSAGFSYGAIMSNTVGCALGDQFRAIAPMSGSGPRGSGCKGQVAAWLSHGDADTTVPFSGGQGSLKHWLANNHCGSDTMPVGDCVAYQGCDEGYPVHWCQFSGGHTQPRNGGATIWAFFSQF